MTLVSTLKIWLIRKLGGFVDIDDYLESLKDYETKRYILTLSVKKLFNTIDADDILKVHENGQWTFQGKPISETEKKLLIAEATTFYGTKLWEILQADIKYQANRKMFLLAQDELQITAGKFWLYSLDAINTRLKSLVQGSGLFNNKK